MKYQDAVCEYVTEWRFQVGLMQILPTHSKVRRVCEILALTLDEVIAAFARSKKEEPKIDEAYSVV
ncbi:MAG: hypothetical protein R6U85_06355 [Salinivirgaceae bacterium]